MRRRKEALASSANSVSRPLALRFYFLEVCGGSGKVSKFVSERGWVVGPVLDLDRSPPHYICATFECLAMRYSLIGIRLA